MFELFISQKKMKIFRDTIGIKVVLGNMKSQMDKRLNSAVHLGRGVG